MASATRPGSAVSTAAGRPCATAQYAQARVQTSPRIMNVAVPWFQHSPMFGQLRLFADRVQLQLAHQRLAGAGSSASRARAPSASRASVTRLRGSERDDAGHFLYYIGQSVPGLPQPGYQVVGKPLRHLLGGRPAAGPGNPVRASENGTTVASPAPPAQVHSRVHTVLQWIGRAFCIPPYGPSRAPPRLRQPARLGPHAMEAVVRHRIRRRVLLVSDTSGPNSDRLCLLSHYLARPRDVSVEVAGRQAHPVRSLGDREPESPGVRQRSSARST